MKHTISALVENKSGVLARIASLFSARGFNISSLAVGKTDDSTISRMTIVLDADEKILEQVVKQLRKLIDVIKVQDLTGQNFVARELVLIKMDATPARRVEIMQIVSLFRARVVDVSTRSLSVEVTGDEKKIAGMLEVLKEFGIKEVVRTGRIAMARGDKS
ncbi:acetolactate synthase small subunit [candidate division NPL-UPA2 bacterium Unc8]|uniref:Acetolactate synthase small subunit n=1 Tax=candidate division NPL-UPA2 bacterium Unc8 TaxID=1980939 RepID=A0A399FXH0_UNCN2|nr:Acetolactate synthase small subunit [Bacillota bacterium]RII00100.1 MAG: acetolactate synthase small subunit [candidate division NPL-UPA2 bacterium Unc8]